MATRTADHLRPLDDEHPIQGEPVAQLAVGHESLAGRVALPWREGRDELGPYRAVAVEVPGHGGFALVSYVDAPVESTVVFGSPGVGLTRRLDELLAGLEVSSAEIIDRVDWSPSEIEAPPRALEETLREGVVQQMESMHASLEVLVQRVWALAALQAEDLTGRRREVAMLLALGMTHEEIAGRLNVTQRTVDRYVHQVLDTDLSEQHSLPLRGELRRSRAH